jgi:hypothetical protein
VTYARAEALECDLHAGAARCAHWRYSTCTAIESYRSVKASVIRWMGCAWLRTKYALRPRLANPKMFEPFFCVEGAQGRLRYTWLCAFESAKRCHWVFVRYEKSSDPSFGDLWMSVCAQTNPKNLLLRAQRCVLSMSSADTTQGWIERGSMHIGGQHR